MRESDLDPNPLRQFETWFEAAREAGIRLPEAMALATATADGSSSARMVLLKGVDERGFVFHTSYESQKGRQLAETGRAALLFYWDPLGRQVRIEGEVAKISAEESDAYFRTRPAATRVSAWASPQSEVIPSREALDARAAELAARWAGQEVPRPPFWGGYRLAPATIEFWEHRDDRLHDRLRYRREGEGWVVERLGP